MYNKSYDIDESSGNSGNSNRYNSNTSYHNCRQSSENLSSEDNASVFDLHDRKILYKVLNVSPQATPREIKRAYYTLAIVYHPDKNPHGEELFKEISFAYNILSDEEQRRMYDAGTLRSYLQGMARSYDPTMDPRVQLSPEALRQFVERLQKEHVAKQEKLSAFEQRREEELRRRAEYDAAHPEFKVQYEQEREKWMASFDKTTLVSLHQHNKMSSNNNSRLGLGNNIIASLHEGTSFANKATYKHADTINDSDTHSSNNNSKQNGTGSSSLNMPFSSQRMCDVKPFRTSAELVASLQEEEQRRLYGERIAEPSMPALRLRSIKEQMMRQYYKTHDDNSNNVDKICEEPSNGHSYKTNDNNETSNVTNSYTCRGMRINTDNSHGKSSNNADDQNSDYCNSYNNGNTMTRKVNVLPENVEYSSSIAKKLRTCTNFDYLDFVEHDKEDNELIKDAILADALGHYSRYH